MPDVGMGADRGGWGFVGVDVADAGEDGLVEEGCTRSCSPSERGEG